MNETVKMIVRVVMYGAPAVFIFVGLLMAMGGYTVTVITGNVGMEFLGIALVIIGIILYVVELALYFQAERRL